MTMAQHTAFAGKLAAQFGNDRFEAVKPRDIVLNVVACHDVGWCAFDARALRNPATGLPYHLVDTPFEHLLETSAASPDFNEAQHAYGGLLSSMHSWGLYNGRYGMSDKVLVEGLEGTRRTAADHMLAAEEARQQRLRATLCRDPETAAWLENGQLMQNYKQLQFFDTLALYFHCNHAEGREPASFTHVPVNRSDACEVTITPLGDGSYTCSPYPFREDALALSYEGRYLWPVDEGNSVREALAAAPIERQQLSLRAA